MNYIRSFFKDTVEIPDKPELFDHDTAIVRHMRNTVIANDIFSMLCKIYMKTREEKRKGFPSQNVYPENVMEPVDIYSTNLHSLLGTKEMYKWYVNGTNDVLEKFALGSLQEKDDPLWYSHMVCALYDIFMYREGIYEKCKVKFTF